MALLHPDTRLCDAILQDTSLIPVIARFGIGLGVGDKSIETICKENNLDTDFFITILNTVINDNYFPQKRLQSFCIDLIIDYLSKTNIYYQRVLLPNIERHFNMLSQTCDSDNCNLALIYKFFVAIKQELLMRIDMDMNRWFPALKKSIALCQVFCSIDEKRLTATDAVEDGINDLLSLFVKNLNGTYDINLCYAVIHGINGLRNDIKQHNSIRNRILRPVAYAIGCDCPSLT